VLYLVIGLFFVTIFLVTYFVMLCIRRKADPIVGRLKKLDKTSNSTLLEEYLIAEKAGEKGKLNPKIEKFLLSLSKNLKQDEKNTSKIRKLLVQAGYHHENSVRIFVSLKIISAIGFFLITIIFVGILPNKPFSSVLSMGCIMGPIGYLIPVLILNSKIRRRQTQISVGLTDALDLLVICVEAGLGLNAAILRVGQDIKIQCKALSEEFLLVNQDLRTGVPRTKALRNMSNRSKVEDLRILVGSLVLADRLGTGIADTLRVQADSLRTRVRQRTEERAAKASIKMLFPLVFFILPALFIILLGPAFISIFETLTEAGIK